MAVLHVLHNKGTESMLRWILLLALVPCPALCGGQAQLSADEIMARVAANQDRAVKQRAEYVYQQRIRVISHKSNGKLMRDETTYYQVTPTPDGTKKELKQVVGKAWVKKQYVEFDKEPGPEPDGLDGDLVHDLRDDLANEKSKDGLAGDLFPLTSDQQKGYQFVLEGEESINGRCAYRIQFVPRDKDVWKGDNPPWRGEALIDAQDFQPVRVYTKLAHKLPLFVRTVLGTNLPGIGFDVEYQRFGEGVWFPVSFGTEFRLRVIFFIKRNIAISLKNSAFEHVHVKSKVLDFAPVQ
jgi:hypothetical protein